MKELTLKDKESLVNLLERHYTIKEKNFIIAIASNDEERLDLTIKAYVIGAEQKNTPTNTNVSTDTLIVVIYNLFSKIRFVKAVREVMGKPLKEAKDYAEQILIYREGTFGTSYSEPFRIGDSMDSIFTKDQWTKICASLGDDMVWRYV